MLKPVGLVAGLVTLLLTPVASGAQCCGDCDGNGEVAINELMTAVARSLGGCQDDGVCDSVPAPGNIDVTIANPLPVPVEGTVTLDEAKIPFQTGVTGHSDDAVGSALLVTVPVDKRLVVEHVSARITLEGPNPLGLGEVLIGRASLLGKAYTDPDFVPCTKTDEATVTILGITKSYWACSVQTKYFAGPGARLDFFVRTGTYAVDFGGSVDFSAFISGYYVRLIEPASGAAIP